MIALLNGFLGDDSVPPDITDTISMVDPSIFSDPQPVAPVIDPGLDFLPTAPEAGTPAASYITPLEPGNAPNQPSFWQTFLNSITPATSVASGAVAASSIASGSVSKPVAPAVPATGVLASAENAFTEHGILTGYPNWLVLGGGAASLWMFGKVFGGRNVDFSYSRRSPRKSRA